MDAIHLKDLAFFAYHGLYEEEARLGQRFLVDLTCWLDLSAACESDEYDQTVCYAGLVKSVEQAVTGTRFNLIERLAAEIVKAVFNTDERIQKVRVKVEKPGAPLPVPSGTASVEIMRNRPG